jgi:hypothetical protein
MFHFRLGRFYLLDVVQTSSEAYPTFSEMGNEWYFQRGKAAVK